MKISLSTYVKFDNIWLFVACLILIVFFILLFSTLDKMAYITIGKVLAQRCLECGISDMINSYEVLPNSKVSCILQYRIILFSLNQRLYLYILITAWGVIRKLIKGWCTVRRRSKIQVTKSLGSRKTRKTMGTLLN